jgi:hypothetical protein
MLANQVGVDLGGTLSGTRSVVVTGRYVQAFSTRASARSNSPFGAGSWRASFCPSEMKTYE